MNDELHALTEFTADIVSNYVAHHSVPPSAIPELIATVHRALLAARTGGAAVSPQEAQQPAVSVKKSVTADYIVCLEDGKSFKSLKRHLKTSYGLSPDDYRAKWNLPSDYPMVAPNYAASRSALAKAIGLGRKSRPGASGR